MAESEPPHLLFISPILPARTGNGLAMRARAMLDVLADNFRIHLLAPGPASGPIPDRCATWCPLPAPRHARWADWARGHRSPPPEWRTPSRRTVKQALGHLRGIRMAHIHVFRLYMLPLAEAVLQPKTLGEPTVHLDLDDIESDARARMAPFVSSSRKRGQLEHDAQFYEACENERLPTCARVYVCGHQDRERLRRRGFDAVSVVPNTVKVGESPPPPEPDTPFTFLFIGNLNHFPNIDGLRHLVNDLLPAMRQTAPRAFRILVVGSGHKTAQRPGWMRAPEVEWVGPVEDVASVYRRAHATLVPLRCGGGTRIKILESFAMGRPVVSTPAGARGLEVRDGEELLIPPDPDAFARACAEIATSTTLRADLATRANAWVQENASPERLRVAVRQALREPSGDDAKRMET